jgi:hypothetical protein
VIYRHLASELGDGEDERLEATEKLLKELGITRDVRGAPLDNRRALQLASEPGEDLDEEKSAEFALLEAVLVEQLYCTAFSGTPDQIQMALELLSYRRPPPHPSLIVAATPSEVEDFIVPIIGSSVTQPVAIDDWAADSGNLNADSPVHFVVGPGLMQAGSPEDKLEYPGNFLESCDEETRHYLEALFTQRQGPRRATWSPPEAEEQLETELKSFRQLVFGLAADLTAQFSKAVEAGDPITTRTLHISVVSDRDDTMLDVENRLAEMGECATDLEGIGSVDELLGAKRLVTILQERFAGRPQVAGIEISFNDIEWLADLSWHVWIFRSPIYPTVEELTTQLSILWTSGTETHRRVDPPQRVGAVEVHGKNLAELVKGCVGRAAPNGKRAEVLKALATVLFQEWHYFERGYVPVQMDDIESTPTTAADLFDGPAGESIGPLDSGRVLPTAFALTPDLQLEHALLSGGSGDPFHVLVPVVWGRGSRQKHLRWLLGTYQDEYRDLHSPRWTLAEAATDFDILGPVVVKLAGSPLHELPRLVSANRSSHPSHVVNVGEIHFMNEILTAQLAQVWRSGAEKGGRSTTDDTVQAIPDWLIRGLGELNPRWWMLGVRLADWVGRFHLFVHLRMFGYQSAPSNVVAFSRSWSDSQSIDLLDVARVSVEFEDLPERVFNTLTQSFQGNP